MSNSVCEFIKLRDDARLPVQGSAEAAGYDLSCLDGFVLHPGESEVVGTGLRISLPQGYEAQVRPRSGLAAKHAITVVNTPGTIDSDFRGELKVILINHGKLPVAFKSGDRIAQLVFCPVTHLPVEEVSEFSRNTDRGQNGFGSTGL